MSGKNKEVGEEEGGGRREVIISQLGPINALKTKRVFICTAALFKY